MARYRLISIVFIAIILTGALTLLTLIMPNNNLANEITVKGTKISFINHGNTWLHMNVILENLTSKDGSIQTYYSDMWIKPNGNVTMDLSYLAGYGDDILPENYTTTLIAWKGLYNDTYSTGSSNLDLNLMGWSGSRYPGADDKSTDINFPDLTINKLPNSITDNKIFTTNDLSKLQQQLQYIQEHGLYEEELIRIDSDGRVTISLIMIAKQPWISNAAGGNKTNLTWIPQHPSGYGLS